MAVDRHENEVADGKSDSARAVDAVCPRAQDSSPSVDPKCRRSSRSRQLIPLVALSVLLVGEVLELRAGGASRAAFGRLDRAFGKESEGQALKPEEVRQVIGRDADEFDNRTGTEIYRWPGAVKTRAVYVQYILIFGRPYARDFALDDDPRVNAPQRTALFHPE